MEPRLCVVQLFDLSFVCCAGTSEKLPDRGCVVRVFRDAKRLLLPEEFSLFVGQHRLFLVNLLLAFDLFNLLFYFLLLLLELTFTGKSSSPAFLH